MKQALTIFLCYLAIAITAQPISSDQVNYILSFQDEKSESLQSQEITATNLNEASEVHTKYTSLKGKVKFILRRGESYQIKYLTESFKAEIPTSGTSFVTKNVIYQNTNKVTNTAISDTIIFNRRLSKPTGTEALLQLILKDKKRNLLPNVTVWLVQPTINKTYQATTNSKGQAIFLLPIGYDYTVNFRYDMNYKIITVPKIPYLNFRKGFTYTSNFMDIQEIERNDTIFQDVPLTQKVTLKRALIQITVLDLDDKPLENETVYLQSKTKVYCAKTNADGETALMLPKGEYYAVNFEFRDSLEVLNIEAGNHTRKDKIRYKYIGSKAIYERILERKYYEALWDSLARTQSFRDSLAITRSPFSNFCNKFKSMNQAELEALIHKRAEADLKELQKNPKYLEEIGDEAAAVLYRNKDKWDDKLIVTDLTCSMHPYIDQILSWHIMELKLKNEEKFENQYMFFNDGNGKPMAEKITGLTGGFHYTEAIKLADLTETMVETMSTGCSIDSPENDMEALLDATQNRKLQKMEIILIADNNSTIRDFELLKSLNVPIRIILAGVFWGVNEEYLELAFHTKGSVHTLEDDLERLYEMNDGDYVKIGDIRYRIYNGRFLKMR